MNLFSWFRPRYTARCRRPVRSSGAVAVEQLETRTLLTTLPAGFTETQIATIGHATAMAIAPDGRLFVTEQGGSVRVVENDTLLNDPFVQVSTSSFAERGLLGIAFDPDFANNQYVYLQYTTSTSPFRSRISRFTANGNTAVPGSETILMELDELTSSGRHNGGAIHFGQDGMLYVATGDAVVPGNSQSLDTTHGKILRINSDGTIPTDNPFYSQTTGNNRAIWALGLRNPFTFSVQPGTGRTLINDVGQNDWEEINDGFAGANFGWPNHEGPGGEPAFTDPIYAYHHSSGTPTGCSIIGGGFYNPDVPQFGPEYVGDYFFGDYCAGWIYQFDPSTGTATEFADLEAGGFAAFRGMEIAPDGSLYYFGPRAGLYRIENPSSQTAPVIVDHPDDTTASVGGSATFTVTATGSAPLSYQWQRNGIDIPGETSDTLVVSNLQAADDGALFQVVVSNSLGSVVSNSARLTVTANQTPTAVVDTPLAGTTWSGGDTIAFSGSGTDPEDGTLTAADMTWEVVFHHDAHTHPFMPPTPGIDNGTFDIPSTPHDLNTWYRIHLTVTDSAGASHSTFRDIFPNTTTLTLDTNVPGLQLTLDDIPITTPFSTGAIEGIVHDLGAITPQTLAGTTYQFASWSDGGAATHDITIPSGGLSLTATYEVASLRPPDNPGPVLPGLEFEFFENGFWSSLPDFHRIIPDDFGIIPNVDISQSPLSDFFGYEFAGYIDVPVDGDYTFRVHSDDGAQLFVGQQLVVDNDGVHLPQSVSGSIGLQAGLHEIRLPYFDRFNAEVLELHWTVPGQAEQPVPDSVLFHAEPPPLRVPENPPGMQPGLEFEYFQGTWAQLPDFDALTPVDSGMVSNFDISGSPADDLFGYEFNGYIDVPADGIYYFRLNSDDGSQLYFGDSLLIDNDGVHIPESVAAPIGLRAGLHRIRVPYFDRQFDHVLEAYWSGPGFDEEPIPDSVLFTATEVLAVDNVTPARDGIEISFSHPIDPAPLNLYDVESDVFGPADVMLTGATVGAVPGSLLVEPSGVTFVPSGGLLAVDTYTLTVRGSANGLRDLAGGSPLDGDVDGVPGGDFETTFAIVPPADPIEIRIPDVVRGPNQSVDYPADATGLPIVVNDADQIESIDVTISYDPALLDVTDAIPGPDAPVGSTVVTNTTTPGQVTLSFSTPIAPNDGEAQLISLIATVPAGAANAAAHRLEFATVSINEDTISATPDDGIHIVGYFGDATGNHSYSGLDAQRIARVVVGLDPGFESYPLYDPVLIADITGDGELSGLDATRVAQEAVGVDRPEIPPLPGPAAPSQASAPHLDMTRPRGSNRLVSAVFPAAAGVQRTFIHRVHTTGERRSPVVEQNAQATRQVRRADTLHPPTRRPRIVYSPIKPMTPPIDRFFRSTREEFSTL